MEPGYRAVGVSGMDLPGLPDQRRRACSLARPRMAGLCCVGAVPFVPRDSDAQATAARDDGLRQLLPLHIGQSDGLRAITLCDDLPSRIDRNVDRRVDLARS